MKRALLISTILPALLALQACVVVVGTESEDGVYFAGERNEEGGIRHDGDSLSRDVARAIAGDGALVAEDLRVSSEDGTVVLKGRVRNLDLLRHAVDVAKGVEGVEHVISKVTVEAV